MAHRTEDDYITQTNINKVKAIYSLKPQLDNVDKLLLTKPLASIIELPDRQIKEWLHSTATFVKDGVQRAKRRLKLNNHSITQFFRPRPTSAATNEAAHATHRQASPPKNDDRPP